MVTVRVPATSANLGSGYDTLGVALRAPTETVAVERAPETTVSVEGPFANQVPAEPGANAAGAVAEHLGVAAAIDLEKRIPVGAGLGSSGASAAGAAVGLNRLFDLGLDDGALVEAAAAGEAVASGAAHADNVAASVLGGLAVVASGGVHHLPASVPLVACVPDATVQTRVAREHVPAHISADDHVAALGNVATVVIGMARDDPVRVGRGLIESAMTAPRRALVPGHAAVDAAARDAGATGVAISGAGPSMLATCEADDRTAVAAAMVDAFVEAGVEAEAVETRVGDGARVADGP
ncbi:MAG: homoserine kinase [Halobacteriales archaeon]